MTTPTRSTAARRLEKAGFRHVAGWLPEAEAQAVEDAINRAAADAQAAAKVAKPRGRPKKQGAAS